MRVPIPPANMTAMLVIYVLLPLLRSISSVIATKVHFFYG